MSEYDRWETRCSPPGCAFGKDPNYFLKSCEPLPPTGRAPAVVADGEGRNGVCLADHGLGLLMLQGSTPTQLQ